MHTTTCNLSSYLRDKKLTIKRSVGDGHCLLYSVITCWNTDITDYPNINLSSLKSAIHKEATKNAASYIDWLDDADKPSFHTALKHYLYYKRYNTCVGDMIPLMITKALNLKITLLNRMNHGVVEVSTTEPDRPPATDKAITVYRNGHHFDAVISSCVARVATAGTARGRVVAPEFLRASVTAGRQPVDVPVRDNVQPAEHPICAELQGNINACAIDPLQRIVYSPTDLKTMRKCSHLKSDIHNRLSGLNLLVHCQSNFQCSLCDECTKSTACQCVNVLPIPVHISNARKLLYYHSPSRLACRTLRPVHVTFVDRQPGIDVLTSLFSCASNTASQVKGHPHQSADRMAAARTVTLPVIHQAFSARRNAILTASFVHANDGYQPPTDHHLPQDTMELALGCATSPKTRNPSSPAAVNGKLIPTIHNNRPHRHSERRASKASLVQLRRPPAKLRAASNIKACLFNVRSVKNKAIEVNEYVVDNRCDICVLVETWLRPGDLDQVVIAELCPPGYLSSMCHARMEQVMAE